jgi:ABC-type transport system involved in multi-copper enzyme maturation permease subunit
MPDLTPLFGLLIVDRDPFTFADLPGLVQAWLMDAGGYAFLGLLVYLLYALRAPADSSTKARIRVSAFMLAAAATAMICYAVYLFLLLNNIGVDQLALLKLQAFDPTGYNKYTPPAVSWSGQPLALSLGGLFALVGIGAPFFAAMAHLVRRMASTGRAPTGTPSLGGTFALLLGLWVVISVAAWGVLRVLPTAREWVGVGAVLAYVLTAAWAAYRCRLWDRMGAVFAVAKLSVLDVIRSRVFLALLVLLLPALFPITWFLPFKAEDELRLTVGMTTGLTQVVLLLMAAALASFAIPNDVKNQNIYTVLTKPVQPFDVVLGRFIGYTALATVALGMMTAGSWLLIEASTISPKAMEETFKARVPIRGKLRYESRTGEIVGTDVGREFNYRKYIAGHPSSSQRAIWSFGGLPSSLQRATDAAVPVEFTFDIYRLTKGVENRGVDVNIRVVSWRCPQKPPALKGEGAWQWGDPAQAARYDDRAKELLFAADQEREPKERRFASKQAIANPKALLSRARPGSPEWEVANKLAAEFGFYEIVSREVFDYHPTTVLVPAGLFANAVATVDADGQPLPGPIGPDGKPLPVPPPQQVLVYVKCETSSQMLGMAEGDLYLLEAEQSFGQNYFKSAVGLWCRLVILIGLSVVCSTYLVGVVSFLAAGFLFVAGYFGQYITELAMGKSTTGGGPVKAFSQLAQAKLPTAPDEGTAGVQAAALADNVFAWLIRRVVNLFPDVSAYDWTPYLAEGFNVSFENLAMNLIVTAGYLLPWLILGFYLIRSREVAA